MDRFSRPLPPILKRSGFQLVDRPFGVDGVSLVSGQRVRELFDPESLRLKRDQKAAAEEARLLFKKAFFAGQLRYYGIKFSSSATAASLRSQLCDAAHQGLCDRVPDSVVALESQMRRDYESGHRHWQAEVLAWDAEQERRQDEAYAKCETPGQQATCDLQRFMDHYFLSDGKPDPTKATEPMALHGFNDRRTLHSRAETVPGLHTVSGGKEPNRTLCIGWDRDKVWALASDLNNQSREAEKRKADARWETAMEEHNEFLLRRGSGGTKPFDIDKLTGSYIIQCEKVTEGWDINKVLTLNVAPSKARLDGVIEAAIDLGVFEGTMLLCLDQDDLDIVVRDLEVASEYEDEDTDEDEYGYGDNGYDDFYDDPSSSSKRNASSAPARQPAKKKQKTGKDTRRVYFRVRGRDTGEGQIYSDPERGHLDFSDARYSTFEGIIDVPFIGSGVKIRGYKVSDEPETEVEDWNNFNEEAYHNARVGRWGGRNRW